MRLTIILTTCFAIIGCTPPRTSTHPYLELKMVREFEIQRDDDTNHTVPEKRVWAIDGHNVAEGPVTTSDIRLDGRASIGGFELEGKYWLTFQQFQDQTLWIYSSTRLGLGDTRPSLSVTEYEILHPQ